MLNQVADHLAEIIDTGTPNQRKALVDRATITGQSAPSSASHKPEVENGPQPLNQRYTDSNHAIRTMTTLVELRGIEPLTYSMRTSRATNCATAPCPRRERRRP